MGQQLGALVLAEDLGSVPRVHMAVLVPGTLTPSSDL